MLCFLLLQRTSASASATYELPDLESLEDNSVDEIESSDDDEQLECKYVSPTCTMYSKLHKYVAVSK